MSKPKISLREPDLDNRLLDDRGPTAARLAKLHGEYLVADTGVINLRITQSPIERAVARGTISEQHGRAANKFYHHWVRRGCAALRSNWKAELSAFGNSDHVPMAGTEVQDFHWGQIRNALGAIHNSMDRCGMSRDAIKLLVSVVCDEIPFETAGKAVWPGIGFNAAGAKAVTYVRGALRVLTIEWGL